MPARRETTIKCIHCGKLLEDTGQEKITCRFCGKVMMRDELESQPAELKRRIMVQTLSANIKRSKTIKLAGYGVAAALLVVGTVFLLFETGYNAPLLELVFLILIFISGLVWFGVGFASAKRLEKDKSKMFDITGGRTVDFKY